MNHVDEDSTNRRGEGHDRGRQTQPSDPATGRQRLLHSCNTFFKRFADRRRRRRRRRARRTCEVGLQSRYREIAFLLHFWFYSHLAALNNLVL